jgi:hypothetical protein
VTADEIAFQIAQVDTLLCALGMVLGGVLFWFPFLRQRIAHRQLLVGRFLFVPLGLLLIWSTFTIGADPASMSPGTRWRMYVVVFATPIIVLFTLMMVVALVVAIERALGRDVERYRPLGEAMNKWGLRLLGFYRPGAVEAARDRKLAQKVAQRLEARKNQRKKTPNDATPRPSNASAPRSHR